MDNEVYDHDIVNIVGTDTYKALWTVFPNLYSRVYDDMIPSQSELDKVNAILSSEDDVDLGPIIRRELIDYIRAVRLKYERSASAISVKLPSISGVLIHSSPPLNHYPQNYITYATWAVIIITIIILVIWNLTVAFRIHPIYSKRAKYLRSQNRVSLIPHSEFSSQSEESYACEVK
jgi:hypothetical protein